MKRIVLPPLLLLIIISYSKAQNFGPTITDVDGNVYQTVTIGDQWWMAENLKTTKYIDGTPIPLVTDNSTWAGLNTAAYCWYSNDQSGDGNIYGALYNWYAVNTDNLCPAGWHVPTTAEWADLTTYLGGASISGGKLKEAGTAHWISPNTGATNETGFTALPGGYRYSNDGNFYSLGSNGLWWSATEYGTNNAWNRYMYYNYANLYSGNVFTRQNGFSVRCISDSPAPPVASVPALSRSHQASALVTLLTLCSVVIYRRQMV